MTDVNGNHPDSVKCPNDLQAKVGAQMTCTMKIKGQSYTVNVTVTKVDGKDIRFDIVKSAD